MKKINYKLRDWIFTRQRYWGEPIPILHDKNKSIGVDEKDLPVLLPEVESYLPTKSGKSPLARNESWKNISINGESFERETNTMPQWAGSCWYYLRFLDPKNSSEFASESSIKYWMPVDLYIGGAEHAVLHLLYSRFWHKVLYDLGLVNTKEPFKKLVNQGMILGNSALIHRKIDDGGYVSNDLKDKYKTQSIHIDISFVNENNGLNIEQLKKKNQILKTQNLNMIKFFMLKEKLKKCPNLNIMLSILMIYVIIMVLTPLRLYEMFLGPLEQSKPWSTSGIIGVHNFLKKFWRLYFHENEIIVNESAPNENNLKTLHRCIKKVANDIENFSFNTAVSTLMITVNELTQQKCTSKSILEPLAIIISSFAPHIAEEIWQQLGNTDSITNCNYPDYDERYLHDSTKIYPVSINGKLKYKIELPTNLSKEEIEKEILADEVFIKKLNGQKPKRVIVVPGKIINFVL